MSDYTSHLFPYLSPQNITTLSCGHVIPRSNLVAWNLSRGPSGQEFEFTFKNRENGNMIDELGRALLNLCTVVPDGVVVFFPSYAYLETVVKRWSIVPGEQKDAAQSIRDRLAAKKSLFLESKSGSVEETLSSYALAIDAGKGGLLLSVVGGKMSEGINFSDRLGRCVVIVGLPFPNIMSAEWKAKIEYIECATAARLASLSAASKDAEAPPRREPGKNGGAAAAALDARVFGKEEEEEISGRAKEAGRSFYENACMRVVNQSVGRAIRHREDYAAIVMVDKRFGNDRIRSKLPGWIREGLVPGAGEKGFGVLMGTLGGFFRGKRMGVA
jgi:chromosome transmission fidelity protein 1